MATKLKRARKYGFLGKKRCRNRLRLQLQKIKNQAKNRSIYRNERFR